MDKSITHIYVYGKIKKLVNNGNIVTIDLIHRMINETIRLSKVCKHEFLNEMIKCGLLKKICRNKFELVTIPDLKKPLDSYNNPLWSIL